MGRHRPSHPAGLTDWHVAVGVTVEQVAVVAAASHGTWAVVVVGALLAVRVRAGRWARGSPPDPTLVGHVQRSAAALGADLDIRVTVGGHDRTSGPDGRTAAIQVSRDVRAMLRSADPDRRAAGQAVLDHEVAHLVLGHRQVQRRIAALHTAGLLAAGLLATAAPPSVWLLAAAVGTRLLTLAVACSMSRRSERAADALVGDQVALRRAATDLRPAADRRKVFATHPAPTSRGRPPA